MKVLVITYCRAMLGANRALLTMIKDMRARYKTDFTVLLPEKNDGELAEVLETEKIPYLTAPMKMWVMPIKAKHKTLRSCSSQLKTFCLSKRIISMIRKLDFDLIYTNNSTVQYGAIIANKRKIPHVWHVREFGGYRQDYDFIFSFPRHKRIRYFHAAKCVIAISDSIKEYAEQELCPGARIKRIYDGLKLEKKLRNNWNTEKPLKIACVAALQSGKCQMDLIMASEKLIDQGYTDIEVYLIGDGEEYRAELESYVAQHKLSKYIIFLGYRRDVSELLNTMDIGVVCSKAEGFGLVTGEYMEASMPVIGANSGATPEIIEDGVTGYLYPHGDINKISRLILKFYKDRDMIRSMGTAGYQRVHNYFDVKKNTDEIYSIFSQFSLTKMSS